jgi:hypothetical protein
MAALEKVVSFFREQSGTAAFVGGQQDAFDVVRGIVVSA